MPVVSSTKNTTALIRWVHWRLIQHYGEPEWETRYAPLEELVGTILSQHTSDVNSGRAFQALTATYATWEAVRDAPVDELIATIRVGGLAVVKAQRIQAVLRELTEDDGRVHLADPRQMTRAEAVSTLTRLPGVGRKTAACVLVFGAHVPAIPVDTHVHRVALRLGLVPARTTADATEDRLEAALKPADYHTFHVNMIRLGRQICKAPLPRCGVCPLRARCTHVVQSGAL
ncbi:MAG: endonuclease III [Chloroflexi bacterium]|nr:endonuclease III [Chloroflexota bacterium]